MLKVSLLRDFWPACVDPRPSVMLELLLETSGLQSPEVLLLRFTPWQLWEALP